MKGMGIWLPRFCRWAYDSIRDQNKNILKDYVLKRQNVNADNTSFAVQNSYVLTERDIPGYKIQSRALWRSALCALRVNETRSQKENSQEKMGTLCSQNYTQYVLDVFFWSTSIDSYFATRAHGYCRKGEGWVQLHPRREWRISTNFRGSGVGSP